MPDALELIGKWWKQIVVIVILSALVAAIVVFMKPRRYLAVATAVPAAPITTDKSKIFSENIEVLYPSIGTSDDLDFILGTARLDTIYYSIADEYNLKEHYKLSGNNEGKQKAALTLKSNTRVAKSEYGELKVRTWDKDRNLCAALANAVMQKLQVLHRDVQNSNNILVLQKIKEEYDRKKSEYQLLHDSLQTMSPSTAAAKLSEARKQSLFNQMQQYEKLIGEYELIIKTISSPLIIVEHARAPLWPDKPKRLRTILGAALVGFIFSFLLVLVLDRRKT